MISCPSAQTCRVRTLIMSVVSSSLFIVNGLAQSPEVTPQSLEFSRQATRRMVFDRSQQIPLAGLDPATIVGFDLMHPAVGASTGETVYSIGEGRLKVSTMKDASSARWIAGFNPFATYELNLHGFTGSGRVGLLFRDRHQESYLSASVVASDGMFRAIEWVVVKDGQEVDRQAYPWPSDIKATGPFRLRVQMLAVGANLYIESQEQSHLVGYPDFNEHLELRHKDLIRRFEFCLSSDLEAGATVEIEKVTSALTPGCGQADIRAITTQCGALSRVRTSSSWRLRRTATGSSTSSIASRTARSATA